MVASVCGTKTRKLLRSVVEFDPSDSSQMIWQMATNVSTPVPKSKFPTPVPYDVTTFDDCHICDFPTPLARYVSWVFPVSPLDTPRRWGCPRQQKNLLTSVECHWTSSLRVWGPLFRARRWEEEGGREGVKDGHGGRATWVLRPLDKNVRCTQLQGPQSHLVFSGRPWWVV